MSMAKPKAQPRLRLMGSDPEMVLAVYNEGSYMIVPANDVMGSNKEKTTASFIGTDNHPATAEVRPPPSHHIKQHLAYLAAGLDMVEKYLIADKRFRETILLSSPWECEKPLGGHIHVSFTDPEDNFIDTLRDINLWWNGSNIKKMVENLPAGTVSTEYVDALRNAIHSGSVLGATTVGRTLDWLLAPADMWLQPWHKRRKRYVSYGPGADTMRPGISHRPKGTLGYHHWEYRLPSTWLVHPWLAYSYLALAKLVMVNWTLVVDHIKYNYYASKLCPDVAESAEMPPLLAEADPQPTLAATLSYPGTGQPVSFTPPPPPPQPTTPTNNNKYERVLLQRIADLKKAGAVFTNDVRDLLPALEYCSKHRDAWVKNPEIRIDEWRRYFL